MSVRHGATAKGEPFCGAAGGTVGVHDVNCIDCERVRAEWLSWARGYVKGAKPAIGFARRAVRP